MATPADLKVVTPYLTRAKELATAEPVIAYWCTYYAVQQGMSVGSKESGSNAFLLELMDRLETMKKDMGENEAISEDAAASAYVDNFASKLFSQADNEDRSGKGTRMTAKKFLAAANFLELLSIFGEVGSEHQEKIKYAKWKASDIAKAFRDGRKPTPGPAGGLPATEELPPASTEVTKEEEKQLAKELAAMGTIDAGGGTEATSPAASTAKAMDAPSYPFPQQPTAPLMSPGPIPEEYQSASSPPLPVFLDAPSAAPQAGSPSSFATISPPPAQGPGSPTPLAPTPPPNDFPHQTEELPPPEPHTPSAPPAFASAVFPSAPAMPLAPTRPSSVPSAPPPASVRAPPPPSAPAHPHPHAAATVPESMDPMIVATIQKHAKWAISALNYDDFDTARKELRAALGMLGG